MAKIKIPPQSSLRPQVSTFQCSANDPVIHGIIESALQISPWITLDTKALRIHWHQFLDHVVHDCSFGITLPESTRAQILSHLEEMGESYELSLFVPGDLTSQIPTDSNDHLNGLVVSRQSQSLAPLFGPWFESYKELAERLLYEWDEALNLKSPPSRSQHMHSRIIPNLKDDLKAARSTHYAMQTRVVYPLALRLRLGSALPSEIEAVTRVTANTSGERGRLLPIMRSYGLGVQALHQAWIHLRSVYAPRHGSSSTTTQHLSGFSHPSFRHLLALSRAFANLVYQRSIYGCDLGGSPKRPEGYGRIEKIHGLVGSDSHLTKKLPFAWPNLADRVLHQMCQALRDFCTYFYSYDPSEGSHARKVLDQIIRLEKAIPRPQFVEFTRDEVVQEETLPLETDFLLILDQIIEILLERSPLLVILGSGMLCTYEISATQEWGFALGPQLMATILADRGLGGALPYQYIRPKSSEPSL